MNVIKCRYEYDNGEVKEWPVRWAITKRMAGATYIHIEGRGTEFDAIIGRYGEERTDEQFHCERHFYLRLMGLSNNEI